jgi:hypothetical protein
VVAKCQDCDFLAKTGAGLAAHRRGAHASPVPAGANAKAIEVTLDQLKQMGRLETIDTARVQALRSIAAALDENPFNSQMWREYREALEGLTVDDSGDGSADDLIDELSAPVRHPA